MACISKMLTTKDGKRFWRIQVRRGRDESPYSTRFYWRDGISQKTAERECVKFAADFERKCQAGLILNNSDKRQIEKARQIELAKLKTVRQYAQDVFMATKEISITENSRANYQQFLDKHIYPAIGDCLLTEVTPAMVKKLIINYQKKGYALASAIKLYNILRGIFEMAYMDDSITISPMLKVKRPVQSKDVTAEAESDKALTAAELGYVLRCAASEPLKWQAYIALSADTGARRGELCGLQWSDINWTQQTITISRNLQYTAQKGIYVASPKNGKYRVVDIGADTLCLLGQLRKEQSAQHLAKWVFSQEGTTDPIHPQSPTRYFKKFGERYNIPNFHPHLLRHTSASIAITHGADVVSTSQRLGHSDTAVTLRMYAHANAESIRAAGQAVRDAVKQDQVTQEAAGN